MARGHSEPPDIKTVIRSQPPPKLKSTLYVSDPVASLHAGTSIFLLPINIPPAPRQRHNVPKSTRKECQRVCQDL